MLEQEYIYLEETEEDLLEESEEKSEVESEEDFEEEIEVKSALEQYLDEIKDFGILTQEEEYDLVLKAQSGDEKAKAKIVECFQKFIVKLAYKENYSFYSVEDIIQDGNVGLLKAIDKFDTSKNLRLSTYINQWFQHEVNRARDGKERLIRVPEYLLTVRNQAKRVLDEASEKGIDLSYAEVAKKIGKSEKQVKNALEFCNNVASLDESMNDDEFSLYDIIEDTDTPKPEDYVVYNERKQYAHKFLDCLNPLERKVMEMDCGFINDRKFTMKEISEEIGLTISKTKTIRNNSIKKMQRYAVEIGFLTEAA